MLVQKREVIVDENHFLTLMEQIEAELQDECVPIHARSIQAILKMMVVVGEDLPISPPPQEPAESVYSGAHLSCRISRWYKKRYGNRMKVDPCSYIAVMIREDVYKIRLSYLTGGFELICRPDLMGADLGPRVRTDAKPVTINILEAVQGLTKNYAESLRDQELRELADRYVMGLHAIRLIKEGAKHFSLMPEVHGNTANAVELLFCTPPQYGFSKWDSLQAAEKVLKAFIAAKGAKFKFTHILEDLALPAELLGLPLIPRNELEEIQCSPEVRYGTISVTASEAVKAHQATLSVCGGVALSLLGLKGIDPPVRMA
jgi:hypothetical protein